MQKPTLTETIVYRTVYWSYFWMLTAGWSLRVSGRHNVPKTGPVLLVSNHESHFDPPLVGIGSPRPLRYLARSTLFKFKPFAWVIRTLGAVPIDREVGTDGLKAVLGLLEQGLPVLMFPEGTRTENGQMQPFKPGISLLAKRAKCTIVPVGIAGCYHAWPRQHKLPTPSPLIAPATDRTIGMHFGEPYASDVYRTMDRDGILRHLEAKVAEARTGAEKIRRKA
jgi:1-acyl-sn-glycerol-3-phosphate acyltransferase